MAYTIIKTTGLVNHLNNQGDLTHTTDGTHDLFGRNAQPQRTIKRCSTL